MTTKAIDPRELQGYEFDAEGLRRFGKRYAIPGVVGGASLLGAFVVICVMSEAGRRFDNVLGPLLLALGLIAGGFSVASYYGPVRCSRCGRTMTKYKDRTVDRELAYGHVYVCEHCKVYFSRKVNSAA